MENSWEYRHIRTGIAQGLHMLPGSITYSSGANLMRKTVKDSKSLFGFIIHHDIREGWKSEETRGGIHQFNTVGQASYSTAPPPAIISFNRSLLT